MEEDVILGVQNGTIDELINVMNYCILFAKFLYIKQRRMSVRLLNEQKSDLLSMEKHLLVDPMLHLLSKSVYILNNIFLHYLWIWVFAMFDGT